VTFERITVEPDKMSGQPCIRGLRIPVATVVAMVADGMSPEEIVAELPELEVEDVAEALRYAAEALRERELGPAGTPARSSACAARGPRMASTCQSELDTSRGHFRGTTDTCSTHPGFPAQFCR